MAGSRYMMWEDRLDREVHSTAYTIPTRDNGSVGTDQYIGIATAEIYIHATVFRGRVEVELVGAYLALELLVVQRRGLVFGNGMSVNQRGHISELRWNE